MNRVPERVGYIFKWNLSARSTVRKGATVDNQFRSEAEQEQNVAWFSSTKICSGDRRMEMGPRSDIHFRHDR